MTTGTASAHGVLELAEIARFYCSVLTFGAVVSIDASSSMRDVSFNARLGPRVVIDLGHALFM